MQFQRKYILHDDSLFNILNKAGVIFKCIEREEFFTSFEPLISYFSINTEYYKSENGNISQISKEIINNSSSEQKGIKIHKKSYYFRLDENEAFLDLYLDDLSDLVVLGINFEKELSGIYFSLPNFLKEFVDFECCKDTFLDSKNLSRFGFCRIDSFANILSRQRNSKLYPFAPPGVSALRAVCLACIYELDLLKSNISDPLLSYKNLQNSISLILSFKSIFDERICNYFIKELKNTLDSMQNIVLLKSFIKFLNKKSPKQKELIEFLSRAYDTLIINFSFKSDEVLREYDLFLSNENDFYSTINPNIQISVLLYQIIKDYCKKLQKILSCICEDTSNTEIFDLKNILSEFINLNRYFGHIFIPKLNIKSLKSLYKLLKKLWEYDCYLMIMSHSMNQSKKVNTLLIDRSFKVRNKIVKMSLKANLELEEIIKNNEVK